MKPLSTLDRGLIGAAVAAFWICNTKYRHSRFRESFLAAVPTRRDGRAKIGCYLSASQQVNDKSERRCPEGRRSHR